MRTSERDASVLAAALRQVFISNNESDSNFESANVVDGLCQGARIIARSINELGTNDASANMGAIGNAVSDGSHAVAGALCEVAAAIDRLAEAMGARRDTA